MTSEGLGEMFEGDSADTCGRKFPLMLMGGRANGPVCADGERGPPSAPAEIIIIIRFKFLCLPDFLIPLTLSPSVTHLWSPPYCFMGGRYSPTRPRRISPATSKHSLKDMEMEWEYSKLYIFHILLIICS